MKVTTYGYTGNNKIGIGDRPDKEKLFTKPYSCVVSHLLSRRMVAATSENAKDCLFLLGERRLSVRSGTSAHYLL